MTKCELGPQESSQWRPIKESYINSEAVQIYDQYIDEGDYSIIHANLRYTQQAYVATVMKVTHALFVQFPHS